MSTGTGAGIAGVGQAAGQIGAGFAAKRQAEKNADLLEELGILAAADELRAGKKLVGTQRAAMAASGGDPNEGTFIDIQAETASKAARSALRAKFAFDSAAFAQEEAGRAALIAGIVGGAGTLLGTATSVLGQPQAGSTGFSGGTTRQVGAFSRNNSAGGPGPSAFTGFA